MAGFDPATQCFMLLSQDDRGKPGDDKDREKRSRLRAAFFICDNMNMT
jgi:hypothetical protein